MVYNAKFHEGEKMIMFNSSEIDIISKLLEGLDFDLNEAQSNSKRRDFVDSTTGNNRSWSTTKDKETDPVASVITRHDGTYYINVKVNGTEVNPKSIMPANFKTVGIDSLDKAKKSALEMLDAYHNKMEDLHGKSRKV